MSSHFCVGGAGETEGGGGFEDERVRFFPPFPSSYLFMSFHFSSIKSVRVFVGVQVRPVCSGSPLVTPPLKEDSINVGRITSVL